MATGKQWPQTITAIFGVGGEYTAIRYSYKYEDDCGLVAFETCEFGRVLAIRFGPSWRRARTTTNHPIKRWAGQASDITPFQRR
ncbi:MAG TPA: hypothetical protein VGV87_02180 [Blastocatellia bacterium]|nr:hypothetical protein [Blastocatellia bacterium]